MNSKEHAREVGGRLRLAIETLQLEQVQVAEEFSVSPQRLNNWLRGGSYPNEWFLARFCDRYGLSMDWFYRNQVSAVVSGVAEALRAASQAPSEG